MRRKGIVLDSTDNVVTALTDLSAGDTVEVEVGKELLVVTLLGPINFGHKFSLYDIEAGSRILKHGVVIGQATRNIMVGEHVHVHNIASLRARGDLEKAGVSNDLLVATPCQCSH